MKHVTHSHLGGSQAVSHVLQSEVVTAITAMDVRPMKGAATKMRDAFLKGLLVAGWSAEMQISKDSKMTITSSKADVGLCLQLGNYARIYADLLKLQTLYLNRSIRSAIVVVPSRPIANILGDNLANAKRLEGELEILRLAYSVPTLVFSLE